MYYFNSFNSTAQPFFYYSHVLLDVYKGFLFCISLKMKKLDYFENSLMQIIRMFHFASAIGELDSDDNVQMNMFLQKIIII